MTSIRVCIILTLFVLTTHQIKMDIIIMFQRILHHFLWLSSFFFTLRNWLYDYSLLSICKSIILVLSSSISVSSLMLKVHCEHSTCLYNWAICSLWTFGMRELSKNLLESGLKTYDFADRCLCTTIDVLILSIYEYKHHL